MSSSKKLVEFEQNENKALLQKILTSGYPICCNPNSFKFGILNGFLIYERKKKNIGEELFFKSFHRISTSNSFK
jgi:hypothetical protein